MSQYKPYPAYKDSGVEWLGRVPEHWQLRRLKHMARFSGGGTPTRDNPEFWNGDIPWVSPKDMKSECITGAEECISAAGLAGSSSSMVPAERVLLVVRSGILKHTIPVAVNSVPVALNQDMKAIWLDSDYLSERFFMRWVQGLNDDLLKVWLKQGATVESIEQEYLADTLMPVPPVNEREHIMQYLDRETARIDALIEKKTRFIELLREKRQALITHAVTKGLDPKVKMKGSGVEWLGEVPEHWSICNVQHVIEKIEQGWSPDCLNTPAEDGQWGVVKSGCVNGGIFNPQENKALPVHLSPVPEYEIKIGDILMSRASGSPELIGSIALVKEASERLMLSDKIFRLQCSKKMVPAFFVMVMGARIVRAQVEQSISGADGLANNLPQSRIKKFVIPCPPIREQLEISSFVDTQASRLHELGERTKRSIALLKERRSALITAAVTGQIDLREAV